MGPAGRKVWAGRENCQERTSQVAGAWPKACKPRVWEQPGAEQCQEGGPGPVVLPGPSGQSGKRLQQMWKGTRGAAFSLLVGRPLPPLRLMFRLVGGLAGEQFPHVPEAEAQLDLKCAWKGKPLPGKPLVQQVRKQPNTCQISLADTGDGWLGPAPPHLRVPSHLPPN